VRRRSRVDDNQASIVQVFRQMGCSVQPIHTLGRGVPDLLVAVRGKTLLVEIKDGSKPPSARRLTPDEMEWHAKWRGDVYIVESTEQAETLIRNLL
jgi:hypothetical protein